jgi:hypothetical protein
VAPPKHEVGRQDFRQHNCKTIRELEQNDSVAPKRFLELFCVLQAKRVSQALAGSAAGHISRTFPQKNMPLEEKFAFFLRRVYASCKKAGLATVSAFCTYGTAGDTLREGLNHYEPQSTCQIHQ